MYSQKVQGRRKPLLFYRTRIPRIGTLRNRASLHCSPVSARKARLSWSSCVSCLHSTTLQVAWLRWKYDTRGSRTMRTRAQVVGDLLLQMALQNIFWPKRDALLRHQRHSSVVDSRGCVDRYTHR